MVWVERLLSQRSGTTAYVKRGAAEVTLHGKRYRRTSRTTSAGLPVYERVLSVRGAGGTSSTAEGAPKPLTTVVLTEERNTDD